MILHRKHRIDFVAQTFNRVVIQIYMRYFHIIRQRFRRNPEVVVLRRDLYLAVR